MHTRKQLGALGSGVGLTAALGGLPDLTPGRVAVAELVLASDRFARVAVNALVDTLGGAHPAWAAEQHRVDAVALRSGIAARARYTF